MLQQKIKNAMGFTLIELILYIGLIAIFVTGAIYFAWDASYAREKAFQNQVAEQNARSILARIAYEIRRAKEINSVSSGSITLENGANDTTISLSSGTVQITTQGTGPFSLSSNQVYVTSLAFSQPGSSDEDTKNIFVEISLRQADPDVTEEFEAATSMSISAELNSQFSQSRQLLMDLTNGQLSSNSKSIIGLNIQNTGDSTLTIDKLGISWSGTIGGENITRIIVGGTTVWTGSQPSGSILDLTNYNLATSSGVASIISMDFDNQMDDGELNFEFIFSDGSVNKSLLTLSPVVVTPTPSTCPLYCTGLGYSGGTCRANPTQCVSNLEIYQSGGDTFCTGGASADTCCCAP
jgi:type II secretory pathway pseudopilin PulG